MPKQFHLLDSNGVVKKNLIEKLVEEGTKDIQQVIKEKRLQSMMDSAKGNLVDVPIMEG